MGHQALSYAAVTPARDEQDNLPRLAESLTSQTVKPDKWVIVENGSTDDTLRIAHQLSDTYPWIEVVQVDGSPTYQRITAEYVFEVGIKALQGAGDLVAKLDADVSFDTEYFANVIAAFAQDSSLGVASGTLMDRGKSGWREMVLLGDHCWGPTRTYRRACLEQVLPLDGGVCFTWVDETKARLAGFETRTLRALPFFHHRPEGADEGSVWASWRQQGEGSYYLGYRPSYLLARCVFRMTTGVAASAMITGYLGAAVRRAPRYPDPRLVATIRDQQRVRHFLSAVRCRATSRPSQTASRRASEILS